MYHYYENQIKPFVAGADLINTYDETCKGRRRKLVAHYGLGSPRGTANISEVQQARAFLWPVAGSIDGCHLVCGLGCEGEGGKGSPNQCIRREANLCCAIYWHILDSTTPPSLGGKENPRPVRGKQ